MYVQYMGNMRYIIKFKIRSVSYQVCVVTGDLDLAGSDGITQSNVKHSVLVQLVTYGNQNTPVDST